MAKTYRTERDILTIEIPIEIPSGELPEDVEPKVAQTIKISAYPAAWRWLQSDLSILENELNKIVKDAIHISAELMPTKKIKVGADHNIFLGDELVDLIYREERVEKGKYHRGKKAKAPEIYDEIIFMAKWLHALFRYYKNHKGHRTAEVSRIYEARNKSYKWATPDPTGMTYLCISILYKTRLSKLGLAFPTQESFRTKYLASAGSFRPLSNKKPELVAQLIDNTRHPLNKIHKIAENCNNTNTKIHNIK